MFFQSTLYMYFLYCIVFTTQSQLFDKDFVCFPSVFLTAPNYNVQIPLSAPFVRYLQKYKTNKSTPAIFAFWGIKIESERLFKPLRFLILCHFPRFSVILPQKRPKRRKNELSSSGQKFVFNWWSIRDSNPWPQHCQCCALPTALMPQPMLVL